MIFDSDVLIWALRDYSKALDAIDGAKTRFVSVASQMELVQGMRDKRELALLKRFLQDFERIPLSADIGTRALLYMEQISLKVQIDPMDALIAATAVELQIPLCTANLKHFRHIPGIELVPFRI